MIASPKALINRKKSWEIIFASGLHLHATLSDCYIFVDLLRSSQFNQPLVKGTIQSSFKTGSSDKEARAKCESIQ